MPVRRLVLWVAISSFLVEIAIAEVWLRLSQESGVLDILLNGSSLGLALGAGALLGVAVALASRAVFTALAPDLIRDTFVPVFGNARYPDILAMSILPGIGEEVLFRGVLQPAIGIIPASLIFGFIHSGTSLKLMPYGLWAAAVGGLLGLLYIATGNLWGSILAHALVNGLGALWLKRLAH